MKLTKYGHACLLIENDAGQRLLIDPGSFTELPPDLSNIEAIVVTEEHLDHFNAQNLEAVATVNPDLQILTTQAVCGELSATALTYRAVMQSITLEAGGFKLQLTPTDHAPIYKVSPCQSIAVQVDDFLYYPSDTYLPTRNTVEVLALPTSGPWHKVSEAIDLANQVSSPKIVATHNGLYNNTGNTVTNSFINNNLTDKTRQYIYLKDSESLD